MSMRDDENEWDRDSMFDEDAENLGGEDEPQQVQSQPSQERVHHRVPKSAAHGGRRVKVKPMPNSFVQRWPDVVSCLLTTASGKQVLLVKGANQ